MYGLSQMTRCPEMKVNGLVTMSVSSDAFQFRVEYMCVLETYAGETIGIYSGSAADGYSTVILTRIAFCLISVHWG